MTTSLSVTAQVSDRKLKREWERVSEEFLADWFAYTFIPDLLFHVCDVLMEALKDWMAGWQTFTLSPFLTADDVPLLS